NQAALIAALKGDLQGADNLCHIQLKWLIHHVPMGSPQNFGRFLQPVINMGRLYRIKKNFERAFACFNIIERIWQRTAIDLIYTSVSHQKIQELFGEQKGGEELNNFLWATYILEYFKNNIRAGKYSEGLQLLESQKREVPINCSDLLREAELILLEQLGRYDLAVENIHRCHPQKLTEKLVLIYHMAVNHYFLHSPQMAEKYCQRLASALETSINDTNYVMLRQLMLQTGHLCLALNMHEHAQSCFTKGFEQSQNSGDTKFSIQFAIGLVTLFEDFGPDRKKWEQEVRGLLAASLYYMPREREFFRPPKQPLPTVEWDQLNAYIANRFRA
ncbi:MAG: hypothetical protein D6730_23915, partial [Bacteroidetes bacterium]